MSESNEHPPLRRTRFVCISDTHNQTPSLPKGDVLVHAGDLSNQGTYSELKKTVTWLEKANFEKKIVIAGNHDITLDEAFYAQQWKNFHNQIGQDDRQCRQLLHDSPSITYLQHEDREIKLTSPTGPKTSFRIFGSPYSPAHGNWAFGYTEHDALALWSQIPLETDIVVTHTPPRGHCDGQATQGRSGCEQLRRRLWSVRPKLHVCGHLHEQRSAELVHWRDDVPNCPFMEKEVDFWCDPGHGLGNRKQSLVDLTTKGHRNWSTPADETASPRRVAWSKAIEVEVSFSKHDSSDNGRAACYKVPPPNISSSANTSTCIVNAAIMAASWRHGPKQLNKPIVVDIDLPTW